MSATILGVPVVDGRAVTPLGVVEVIVDADGRATYSLHVVGGLCEELESGHYPDGECAARGADAVLHALWDAVHSAEAERRGRVAGLREAAAAADRTAGNRLVMLLDGQSGALAVSQQIRDRADAIERGEP